MTCGLNTARQACSMVIVNAPKLTWISPAKTVTAVQARQKTTRSPVSQPRSSAVSEIGASECAPAMLALGMPNPGVNSFDRDRISAY